MPAAAASTSPEEQEGDDGTTDTRDLLLPCRIFVLQAAWVVHLQALLRLQGLIRLSMLIYSVPSGKLSRRKLWTFTLSETGCRHNVFNTGQSTDDILVIERWEFTRSSVWRICRKFFKKKRSVRKRRQGGLPLHWLEVWLLLARTELLYRSTFEVPNDIGPSSQDFVEILAIYQQRTWNHCTSRWQKSSRASCVSGTAKQVTWSVLCVMSHCISQYSTNKNWHYIIALKEGLGL